MIDRIKQLVKEYGEAQFALPSREEAQSQLERTIAELKLLLTPEKELPTMC